MRVLAIDQSLLSTGLVILDVLSTNKLDIHFQLKLNSKQTGIHRLNHFRNWCVGQIVKYKPDIIVRELHNQQQFGGAIALQHLSSILDLIAIDNNYLDGNRYVRVPNTSWKKLCIGKGSLKKDTTYMMHLNKFFNSQKYLTVPEDFQVLDDNLGDAICIGITGFIAYGAKTSQPYILSHTDALPAITKSIATMFDYGIQ